MGLHYESTVNQVLIGSKNSANTRTSATLTDAYAGGLNGTLKVTGYSKINLDILYTMGATESSNTIEWKIECSPDGTNYYRIPNEAVSGGTSTETAREYTFTGTNAAAATISIGLDIFYNYVKVSFKESGVASNAGTLFVEATLCGK